MIFKSKLLSWNLNRTIFAIHNCELDGNNNVRFQATPTTGIKLNGDSLSTHTLDTYYVPVIDDITWRLELNHVTIWTWIFTLTSYDIQIRNPILQPEMNNLYDSQLQIGWKNDVRFWAMPTAGIKLNGDSFITRIGDLLCTRDRRHNLAVRVKSRDDLNMKTHFDLM
jgi:hypothetical protein